MAIFGASGDLTTRKLLPALYNLARNQLAVRRNLHSRLRQRPMSEEDFRKRIHEDIHEVRRRAGPTAPFATGSSTALYYITGDFTNPDDYVKLKDKLAELDAPHTRTATFSITSRPPQFFGPHRPPARARD
jgi:glucose-6-phosphate 1-dehydrogenase